MQLTAKVKLCPTMEQEQLLTQTMQEYISLVNDVVAYSLQQPQMPRLSSAAVYAKLPSALKNQALQDAKSVYRRSFKLPTIPVLKKPVAIWNNQNYSLSENAIQVPMFVNGKSCRIKLKAIIPEDLYLLLSSYKTGTLRITKKNGKYLAQIVYEQPELGTIGTETMGIDLGIKCPAVCRTSNGKTRFVGNGRQNKYLRRKYKAQRKSAQKSKKKMNRALDKEARVMKDIDHKLSREIVNFAIKNDVGTIKLEDLTDIRNTARTSRKNNYSLGTWTFYRLASYIEYKAALAGIEVKYIDPHFTSQCCPVCGTLNHAKDRRYVCSHCGHHEHRDLVGAINIMNAPVTSGKRKSA